MRLCTLLPASDRDARALAGRRFDVELVRELARTVEAEAEAIACRIAVAQREFDVDDAGALVFERQAQPDPLGALVDALDAHLAAAAVDHRVARQLAGGSYDLGLLDQAEAEVHRAAADDLSCLDYVFAAADRERFEITCHRRVRPGARPLHAAAPDLRPRSMQCESLAGTSRARPA